MDHSMEVCKEGLAQSSKTVNVLSHIETMVNNVAATSKDIDSIIVKQSMGAEQILKTTEQLMSITHEIQSASHEQALATEEIVESIGQVRFAAERNAELSEKLSASGSSVYSQSVRLEKAISVFHLGEE